MTNWTKQEDEALKAGYIVGRPVSKIAEAVGRTPGAVRGRAAALGISKQNAAEIIASGDIGFPNEDTCKFCGQLTLTGDCDCPGAHRERKIQDQIERAIISIQEIFGEGCEESGYKPVSEDNIEIMNDIAVQIANYKLHGVALILPSGTRAKLARASKGAIKVERSEVKKLATEVEE